MAHAGEKVILRLIQFLDLLLLLSGKLGFLIIEPCEKQEKYAGERTHHNDGKGGIEKGMALCVLCHKIREIESRKIAQKRFNRAQQEKDSFSSSLQGNADIDEAEHEPFGHSAAMAVAPVWIRSFRILNFTMAVMKARLAARISRFAKLLPMRSIMVRATMLIPVTTRNIRSRRLILWSKIISNHFFNTWRFLLSFK